MSDIERLKKDNLLLNRMLTEVSTDCINYKHKLEKIKDQLIIWFDDKGGMPKYWERILEEKK